MVLDVDSDPYTTGSARNSTKRTRTPARNAKSPPYSESSPPANLEATATRKYVASIAPTHTITMSTRNATARRPRPAGDACCPSAGAMRVDFEVDGLVRVESVGVASELMSVYRRVLQDAEGRHRKSSLLCMTPKLSVTPETRTNSADDQMHERNVQDPVEPVANTRSRAMSSSDTAVRRGALRAD